MTSLHYEIQIFDKGIHQPHRVIGSHLLFQGAEITLMAVISFYKLHTPLLQ
jgi:hypothetical protein